MKKMIMILLTALLVFSCESGSGDSKAETGFVTVNLTDAPVSTDNLTKVNINVSEISAQISGTGDDGWQVLKTFNPGLDINLLDYTGGLSMALAEDVELPAGKVNQIRFMLNAPEEGEDGSNPGCYLEYDRTPIAGIETYPLYVPSGSSSGFKAVGSFDIPVNGSVTVTADFDARRSLVDTGDNVYKLKPVIRLIVDNEAGRIVGDVTINGDNYVDSRDETIYAYKAGSYEDSENIANDDGLAFTNAVNSAPIKDGGSYVLPFLAEGEYDLVVAQYTDAVYIVTHTAYGVTVTSGQTTTQNINIE